MVLIHSISVAYIFASLATKERKRGRESARKRDREKEMQINGYREWEFKECVCERESAPERNFRMLMIGNSIHTDGSVRSPVS